MTRVFTKLGRLLFVFCYLGATQAAAQQNAVTVTVSISRTSATNAKASPAKSRDSSGVAVWLTPLGDSNISSAAPSSSPKLVQRNKTFEPHVLIVPVGTMVAFPNKDPFFHNIFSLYDGKRFDLGLYEAGTTRTVLFDRPGVSFLFCNIHAEMSAVVIAVNTPYFGLSDRSGNVVIPNVPNGRYELNVWYERSLQDELKALSRTVMVSDTTRNLGIVRISENPNFTLAHKNKYGLDYVPPPNPGYSRP